MAFHKPQELFVPTPTSETSKADLEKSELGPFLTRFRGKFEFLLFLVFFTTAVPAWTQELLPQIGNPPPDLNIPPSKLTVQFQEEPCPDNPDEDCLTPLFEDPRFEGSEIAATGNNFADNFFREITAPDGSVYFLRKDPVGFPKMDKTYILYNWEGIRQKIFLGLTGMIALLAGLGMGIRGLLKRGKEKREDILHSLEADLEKEKDDKAKIISAGESLLRIVKKIIGIVADRNSDAEKAVNDFQKFLTTGKNPDGEKEKNPEDNNS